MCVGSSAPLSVFAAGRTTGLVVESGAGLTSTVPVFEGLSLTHAAITAEYGGQDITCNLRQTLQNRGVEIDMADTRLLKERMAAVTLNPKQNSKSMISFGLPDGTEVNIESRVFNDCTEPLLTTRAADSTYNGLGGIGLIDQAFETLRLCDDSVRKDLAHNIILSGGTTMLPGNCSC